MPSASGGIFRKDRLLFLAESQGFEPWDGYKPSHDFQSCALDHSANSPWPEDRNESIVQAVFPPVKQFGENAFTLFLSFLLKRKTAG